MAVGESLRVLHGVENGQCSIAQPAQAGDVHAQHGQHLQHSGSAGQRKSKVNMSGGKLGGGKGMHMLQSCRTEWHASTWERATNRSRALICADAVRLARYLSAGGSVDPATSDCAREGIGLSLQTHGLLVSPSAIS